MSSDQDQDPRPIPMWVGQWHSRDRICELLEVSARTIQRRVQDGAIERRRLADDTRSYRLVREHPWARRRLRELGDKGGRQRGGRQQTTGGDVASNSPAHMRSTTGATGGDTAQGVTGATAELEELRAQVAALADELAHARRRIAHLEARRAPRDATDASAAPASSNSPEQLAGWRRLALLILARVKALADWLHHHLEES